MMALLKLLFFLGLIIFVVEGRKGIVELDEITFGRVVDGSRPTLVALLEHSWKDPDGYENVPTEFKDLLVAKIDSATNQKLENPIKGDKFPTFAYYAKGSTTPSLHEGDLTDDEILDFVRVQQNPSLQRLKSIAKEFVADKAQRAKLLKEAEKIVTEVSGESDKNYAKIFTHTMTRINEKGEEYISSEIKRLDGLIENKSTREDKKREFSKTSSK